MQPTRSELYDWVWTQPLTRVASLTTLSASGLLALCRRRQIPTPPRGYWTRRKAETPPCRVPLPPGDDSLLKITLTKEGLKSLAKERASRQHGPTPSLPGAGEASPDLLNRPVGVEERPAVIVTVPSDPREWSVVADQFDRLQAGRRLVAHVRHRAQRSDARTASALLDWAAQAERLMEEADPIRRLASRLTLDPEARPQ